jgi:arylsulfatase
MTNLKVDSFERFEEARGYDDWLENRAWTYFPAAARVLVLANSFKEYPPRQQRADLNVAEILRLPPLTAR